MPKRKKNLYSLALAREDQNQPNRVDSYRAELEWREGMPYLVSAPVKLSEAPENALRALLRTCLDLPYDGRDPTLVGMTQGEAMMINLSRDAAIGDPGARELILDRLLGKSQQNIKSVNLSGNLSEFLDNVAKKTKIQSVEVPIEDATIINTDVEDL